MEQKQCRICKVIQSIENFHIHTKGKKYYRTECKKCKVIRSTKWAKNNVDKRRKYHKDWYYTNRNKRLLQEKERHRNLKNKIFSHYGAKCKCCGETEIVFLTIDHVSNNGNKERKNGLWGKVLYKRIIENNFPDSYQVYCMNCNIGKHLNGGTCPHKRKTWN